MRDLTPSDKNEMIISDARSGSEILLYYRNPTTEEEVGYQANLFRKAGKKLKIAAFETRLKYGLKILTGFRDGDFGIDGRPIASDPASPHYREDWKALVARSAPDIVNTFAFAVFEGARVDTGMALEMAGDEDEPEGETEPDPPFARS